MNFFRNRLYYILAAVLIVLSFNACQRFEGAVTVPSYIYIGGIDVVRQAQYAPSSEDGFYSSNIDVVELFAYFEGDATETRLGAFELPCTVPVLREGKMKYLTVNAAVKQGGISGVHIAYPFYQPIRLENVELKANDTTFLGTYDSAAHDYMLHAHYYPKGSRLKVLAECYFEPTSFSTCFDSNVVWVANDPAGACTGQGYGRIHLNDTTPLLNFGFADSNEFNPANSRILYMEMDFKIDMPLWIHMLGFLTGSTGTVTSKSVQALNPTTQWKKIYINLGRTWSQFNYNTPISVYFQAVNEKGINGDLLIDNIKVLTTE